MIVSKLVRLGGHHDLWAVVKAKDQVEFQVIFENKWWRLNPKTRLSLAS